MPMQIHRKIVGYSVRKPDAEPPPRLVTEAVPEPEPESGAIRPQRLDEKVERPGHLTGATYKIKTPLSEHALYVTVNDIVLNAGTPQESVHPFEIFINSKNMDHFQWIVALTRILSSVFRKGGNIAFLIDELKSVVDPKGGYFKQGGYWSPSLVAEIGEKVEAHMRMRGLIGDRLDPHQKALVAEKRAEYDRRTAGVPAADDSGDSADAYPPEATLCDRCHDKAVIIMDGCRTCLACGASKCG